MKFDRDISRTFVRFALASVALAALLLAAGCTQGTSGGSTSKSPTPAKGDTAPMNMGSGGTGSVTQASDVQKCSDCAGKGMAPMVDGTVETVGGTQVVSIGIKNGYYTPNQFTAKAGTPIKVVFTGKAAGCLGKPQFKSLNQKADFITSGTATIELGSLTPGTYAFECGMGMVGGKLIVQ